MDLGIFAPFLDQSLLHFSGMPLGLVAVIPHDCLPVHSMLHSSRGLVQLLCRYHVHSSVNGYPRAHQDFIDYLCSNVVSKSQAILIELHTQKHLYQQIDG